MPRQLKGLDVDEVSLVDRPANNIKFMLFKAAAQVVEPTAEEVAATARKAAEDQAAKDKVDKEAQALKDQEAADIKVLEAMLENNKKLCEQHGIDHAAVLTALK